jgi:hypothetical protein
MNEIRMKIIKLIFLFFAGATWVGGGHGKAGPCPKRDSTRRRLPPPPQMACLTTKRLLSVWGGQGWRWTDKGGARGREKWWLG